MKLSLKEIAELIDGKIFGDENLIIKNISKIEESQNGDLTFLYLPAYEKYFPVTKASAILVKPGFNKTRKDISYIEVKNPNSAFFLIIEKYFKPTFNLKGIDNTAFVDTTAVLSENVSIGRNVVVSAGCRIGKNVKIFHNTVLLENVEIGDNSFLFSNVSVRENCKIGERVIVHSGTVIGSDGFGYEVDSFGVYHKIPQVGNVVIGDDVEIGSNVSIDRATIGSTIIKKGVKIDNLVQVAHNVVIGENTVLVAQCGVSGSTKVGNNCILAGQAGLVGHIELADKVIISAQSGYLNQLQNQGNTADHLYRNLKLLLE